MSGEGVWYVIVGWGMATVAAVVVFLSLQTGMMPRTGTIVVGPGVGCRTLQAK